jgi:hypothetical protein
MEEIEANISRYLAELDRRQASSDRGPRGDQHRSDRDQLAGMAKEARAAIGTTTLLVLLVTPGARAH